MDARILAMGMSSSLGPVVTACAAFRAGISRARASLDFQYSAAEDNEPRPLTVCAIPSSTFGFSGIGRLVAIMQETLLDLWPKVEEGGSLDHDTSFHLALPDPLELELPLEPEAEADLERRVVAVGRCVLSMAFKNLGIAWPGGRWRFFSGGHTAFAQAMTAALDDLRRRGGGSCIVAAADSLLDPVMLERLLLESRLKTEDKPVGFIPGEAGVAILMHASSSRKATVEGRKLIVRRMALERGGPHSVWDGRALTACVEQVTCDLGRGAPAPVLVSDHNGEEGRAAEWGGLLVRMKAKRPEWHFPVSWFPATGFGETGCASSAVGFCVAARGLLRGYAPSPHCIVLSSSENGEAAAMLLERGL